MGATPLYLALCQTRKSHSKNPRYFYKSYAIIARFSNGKRLEIRARGTRKAYRAIYKKYGCSLFCDLSKYERILKPRLHKGLLCGGTLKPYCYSPSKINIALGLVSFIVTTILLVLHIWFCFSNEADCLCFIFAYLAICLFAIFFFMKDHIKGGN